MKLHGYKPPPLPKPPRKPSKWIKDVVFPPIPEPDRSRAPDPRTYDFKGSNQRIAAWLFLGLALATGVAMAIALWRKPAVHACAGACGRAGGPVHVHPTQQEPQRPSHGSPAVPTK